MSKAIDKWFGPSSLSPFREFSSLQDSFDRMVNEWMSLKRNNGMTEFSFSPSCEVTEDAGNFVLKFDMPGVKKEQVEVEADNNQLTVRAERREESKSETNKKHLSEVYYGSYSRTFTLPAPIDDKKVGAKFENGVLTVTVPKTEAAKSRTIPVQ